MFVNYLCFFIFLISFLSSTALFCNNLTSTDDKDTPCFLESSTQNPVLLRTSGNSLVLPCHVAHSKRSSVEWWYTDVTKSGIIKIYPIYPPVRPTVLRFVTSLTPSSKKLNATDILDASILLRYVNVDDSGVYRCVIRRWTADPLEQVENTLLPDDDPNAVSLSYQVQLTAPRLCQANPGTLPCFTAMRTSSPTVIDAYQTAFLQCVVKNQNRQVNVFWVVGDSPVNNVLITDFLTANQYNGDRLKRVFPLSPFDSSIELSVNRTLPQRVYSCVIEGDSEPETTLFTYIVRTIDVEEVGDKTVKGKHKEEKIAANDTLNHSLRESQKDSSEEENLSQEDTQEVDRDEKETHTED